MSATNALLYLYGTSLRNSLVQRVKRLRQPKYLMGALAGGAYFYFFLFRHVFRGSASANAAGLPGVADTATLYVPIAALVLLILVVLGWILPSSRAALLFTEASVAFLFPAPLTRRMLIHSQLLRSQIAIFFSAFFLTLIFRRGSSFGGSSLTHALGWWVILSTLNLHLLGASFVREWMLELGLRPWLRRLVLLGVLVAVLAGCWLAVRQTVALPRDADTVSYQAMVRYADGVLSTGAVAWVLAPFRVVVAPYFAPGWSAFAIALGPALLLLVLHYFWVIRTNVAFEEASIELATKRAERIAAYRAGRWRSSRDVPNKPRPEPFALRPRGWIVTAYLWKNLIALGAFYRLRTWLIACVVAVAGISWVAGDPARLPILQIVGVGALIFAAYAAAFLPMLMRRDMQQTLEHMDIVKSYPLQGWQVVLGALTTPMVLLVFIEWWLLLVAVLALGPSAHNQWAVVLLGSIGAGGVALLIPPLCGLMLCIPFAGVLYFPAWGQAPGAQQAGGIEVMGQRLIFLFGTVIVLVVSILPAAAAGVVAFFVGKLIGPTTAVVAAALSASALLCFELAGAVHLLGLKIEKFDLSTELPR